MRGAPGWLIIDTLQGGKAYVFAGSLFGMMTSTPFDLEASEKAAKEEMKEKGSFEGMGFKHGDEIDVSDHIHVRMVKATKTVVYIREPDSPQSSVIRSCETDTSLWKKFLSGFKELEKAAFAQKVREVSKLL